MVGDSVPTDIIGARSAGIKAILLDRRNRREFLPKITNLRELKELMENGGLEEFLSKETEIRMEGADE